MTEQIDNPPRLDEAMLDDLTEDVAQIIGELRKRPDAKTAVTTGAFSRRIANHVSAAVRAATLDEAEQAVEHELAQQRALDHITPYGADQFRSVVAALRGTT